MDALPAAICRVPVVVPSDVAPPPIWFRVTASSPVEARTTETTSSSSVQLAAIAVPREERSTTGSPTARGSPVADRLMPAISTVACWPSCASASMRVPSRETASEAIESISDQAVATWYEVAPSEE
ncbi:hypothetical protein GRS96_14850 [Rathayibacter sp. VKM Ac-2803]|nr:hypothetical protein [Rathayibacter sp. VKM Ac-2803]MWV59551.1 hypothetical protein [Rathayibacter sp. VKM Ac-2754]